MMNKKYLNKIDYLRGLAILGVVAIHTMGAEYFIDNNFIYILYTNLDQLSAFSVPFFMFISGLVLTYNYGDIKLNYAEFIKRRLFLILIPYIIWSCIYLIYNLFTIGKNIDLITVIRKLITGNAEFHLYFIVLMMQFYLIFPFILKYIQKFRKYHTSLLVLIFLFNLFIISAYYYQFDYLSENRMKKIFIFWIFYFVLGMVIGNNINSNKYYLSNKLLNFFYILFLISYINLDISYFSNGLLEKNIFWLRPQILIFATLSIIITYKFINDLKITDNLKLPAQLLRNLGQNSFGIYLSHVFFLNILSISFEIMRIDYRTYYYNILLFLAVVIVSLLFVMTISRLSFGRFVVGKTYPNKFIEVREKR